jgi:nitrous oxidase accessory protein NosD
MSPSALRPSRSGRKHRAPTLRLALEALEDRRILAAFSYDGPMQALSITLDAEGEMRVASSGSGNYVFTLVSSDTFKGTDATGLSGNGLGTLTVTSALDIDRVSITNSVNNTAVNFIASTGTYVDHFNVVLTRSTGAWVPLVKVSGATAFAANSSLTAKSSNINVEATTLSSATGDIKLDADTDSQVPGTFSGVIINGSTITTSGGSILLKGRGGDYAGGYQRGVAVIGNSFVMAGSDGTMQGRLSIAGNGGASTGPSNQGIIIDRGSTVGSSGGGVSLRGKGGTGSTGANGILLQGRVTSATATGAGNEGEITLNGTGGGSASGIAKDNTGVSLTSTAAVQSDEGPISIEGRGGEGNSQTAAPYTTSPGLFVKGATVTSSAGPITFTGDAFGFDLAGGMVATTKTVTVRNIDADQVIRLGGTANGQLTRIAASKVIIGRSDLLPIIQQETAANGGTISLANPHLQMIGSKIVLRSPVTTGGTQTYTGPVLLGEGAEAVTPTLTASGITFEGTVDGAKNLTLAAGSGPILFAQAVGATTPLASLKINTASAVKASAPLSIDGSAAGARASGLVFAPGVNGIDMQVAGSKVANCTGSGIVVGPTHDSRIAGFTLTKNAVAGIQASGAMPATIITGNRVEGGGKGAFGAHLSGATGLSFGTPTSGNVITGTSTGIVATGDMTGSAIRSNTVKDNVGGINLIGARNLAISANGIGTSALYGLRADGDNSGTVVTSNAITGTKLGVSLERARGLSLGSPGAGNTIAAGLDASGAYVPGRTSVGIAATGDLTGTRITANSISDNTIGLQISDAHYLSVTGNMLFRDRFQGILTSGNSAGTTIQSNTIEGSLPGGGRAAWGIYVASATGLLVGGDSPTLANGVHGTDSAIGLTGLLTGTAIKSTIIRNTFNAIQLQAARGVWVQSNDVNGAEGRGLSAKGDCSGSTVLLNTIHLGANGVMLEAAQGLAVKNNRIASNRGYGVFATGPSAGTKVSDNVIENNGINLATSTASSGWFQPK